MDIWLNGAKADIRLEHERHAGEVLQALERWAESQGFLLDEMRVDGKHFSDPADPALERLAVDQVQRVELRLVTPSEYAFLVLGEIDAYLARMKARLEGDRALEKEEVEQLLQGVEWLRKTLTGAVKPLRLSADLDPLLAALKEAEIALFRMRDERRTEFQSRLNASIAALESGARLVLRRGYFQLVRQLLGTLGADHAEACLKGEGLRLVEILRRLLPDSASEIHKGRDSAAMPLVQQAVEAMELLLALLERAEMLLRIEQRPGKDLPAQLKPLEAKLVELEDAFQRRDLVLLGDLLEYELVGLLPDLEGLVLGLAGRFSA